LLADGAKSAEELAEASQIPLNRIVTLTTALASIGILSISDNKRIQNSPAAQNFLAKQSKYDFGDYLRYQIDQQMYPFLLQLNAVMKGDLSEEAIASYEKAVQFPSGGSITIVAVTTLSGGDITHAIPDNTGYITEGQLFLRRDTDIGKVIVDPFRSLSRLKQLVIGEETREDHPQVMNTAVRLYADAANARTKQENGFDLTDYDERTLDFAKSYSEKLLAIDVNVDTDTMLNIGWELFGKHFSKAEVGIKKEMVDKYWKGQ
jgi:hypothetical protein